MSSASLSEPLDAFSLSEFLDSVHYGRRTVDGVVLSAPCENGREFTLKDSSGTILRVTYSLMHRDQEPSPMASGLDYYSRASSSVSSSSSAVESILSPAVQGLNIHDDEHDTSRSLVTIESRVVRRDTLQPPRYRTLDPVMPQSGSVVRSMHGRNGYSISRFGIPNVSDLPTVKFGSEHAPHYQAQFVVELNRKDYAYRGAKCTTKQGAKKAWFEKYLPYLQAGMNWSPKMSSEDWQSFGVDVVCEY